MCVEVRCLKRRVVKQERKVASLSEEAEMKTSVIWDLEDRLQLKQNEAEELKVKFQELN